MTPIIATVIAVEQRRWNRRGAKEQVTHDLFGVSATRYAQAVNAIVDRPEALMLDPVTVNRLRRLRETRKANR